MAYRRANFILYYCIILTSPVFILIVPITKQTGSFLFFLLIFDDMDSAESNHAAEEGCVFLRLNINLALFVFV